jgi:UDP-glucose 4-epimerase
MREMPPFPSVEGKSCLVIGAGGFIGTALCKALCDKGARVRGLVRHIPPTLSNYPISWNLGDYTDRKVLAQALRGQDAVFHLASGSIPETSNKDPAADLSANVLPALILLELCHAEGVGKILFPSSGGTVYGMTSVELVGEATPTNPISAYGISKLMTEKYLNLYHRLYALDFRILRISNPYGPGQSHDRKQGLVATVLHRALTGKPVEIWGTGEVVRDYLHITDVANAFIYATYYEGHHRIMNVGSGQGLSINRVIDDIEEALGNVKIYRQYRPSRPAEVPVNVLDISLINRETGWRPEIEWSDGLQDTINWRRAALNRSSDRAVATLTALPY